jgi:hypothetical protein
MGRTRNHRRSICQIEESFRGPIVTDELAGTLTAPTSAPRLARAPRRLFEALRVRGALMRGPRRDGFSPEIFAEAGMDFGTRSL